jgi:predicted HicB family RNase H-like nuclease
VAQEQRNYQMTIRIPKRIHRLIKIQADDEQRSVADIVNHVLAAHCAARDGARSRRR